MKVGEHTAFALMVMVDVFFPEKIHMGSNTIIGYNTTILAHEYLTKEYQTRRCTYWVPCDGGGEYDDSARCDDWRLCDYWRGFGRAQGCSTA